MNKRPSSMNKRPSSPKQLPDASDSSRRHWFPYYAGFSNAFVRDWLDLLQPQSSGLLLDPWLGSGTTLFEGARAGVTGIGFDLNPAMVVVTKARLLDGSVAASLRPLGHELVEAAHGASGVDCDPLLTWFRPEAAAAWRRIALGIGTVLLPNDSRDLTNPEHISRLSSLAAFYYVALFRALRRSLARFGTTNPTWVRVPQDGRQKISPSWATVSNAFLNEVELLAEGLDGHALVFNDGAAPVAGVGDARSLPIVSNSVDAIVTSPPYCTRIDYAVATRPELALLGYSQDTGFRKLRENLTGSTAIREDRAQADHEWGPTCTAVLRKVTAHPSKASGTYYRSQFVQYFSDMYLSLSEISRVLKSGRDAVLVVQDSYYKDVRIDLAKILIEMAGLKGLAFVERHDYPSNRSMRHLNPNVQRRPMRNVLVESALRFASA